MRRSGIDNPNQELSFVHIRILIRRLAPTVLVTLIFFSLSLTTIISFLPIDRETFPQIRSTYSSIVQSKFLRLSTNSSILSYLENNKQTAMLATERFDSKRQELLDAASAGIQLTKVDFSNMNLEEFPLQLLLPFEESLEFLNFGGNKLSTLPDELAQFRNLKILFFAGNNFETVPRVLGELPSLYMLSFKGNKLRSIPEESLPASISWLILTDNHLSGRISHFFSYLSIGFISYQHISE
jgi:Leucine-rich repeat (LRR) protein